MDELKVYRTPEGDPLVVTDSVVQAAEALLTVAVTGKWYSLWLLRRVAADPADDWIVEQVLFGAWHDDAHRLKVVPYVDHVPNPVAVEAFAERMGYELDDCGFDLMVGRWHTEVLDDAGYLFRAEVKGDA